MPAAMLIFIVLGAIAVDSAVVFLAEREMANSAAAAANDAAGVALDTEGFYADGEIRLDPALVGAVARASVAGKRLEQNRLQGITTTATANGPIVTVTVSADVPYIFFRALPGGPDSVRVSATGTADARENP